MLPEYRDFEAFVFGDDEGNGDEWPDEEDGSDDEFDSAFVFSEALEAFYDNAVFDKSIYFICNYDERLAIARGLDDIPLTIHEKWACCNAPINRRVPETMRMLVDCASQYAHYGEVEIDIKLRSSRVPATSQKMLAVENLIKSLDVYLWLSNQSAFDRDAFISSEGAKEARRRLAELVSRGIAAIGDINAAFSDELMMKMRRSATYGRRRRDRETSRDKLSRKQRRKMRRKAKMMKSKHARRAN